MVTVHTERAGKTTDWWDGEAHSTCRNVATLCDKFMDTLLGVL